MTKKEREILERMYKDLEHPSVEGVEYDSEGRRKELNDQATITRCLAPGSDYRKGWERARVIVYLWLRELGFPTGGR